MNGSVIFNMIITNKESCEIRGLDIWQSIEGLIITPPNMKHPDIQPMPRNA